MTDYIIHWGAFKCLAFVNTTVPHPVNSVCTRKLATGWFSCFAKSGHFSKHQLSRPRLIDQRSLFILSDTNEFQSRLRHIMRNATFCHFCSAFYCPNKDRSCFEDYGCLLAYCLSLMLLQKGVSVLILKSYLYLITFAWGGSLEAWRLFLQHSTIILLQCLAIQGLYCWCGINSATK